MFEVRSGSAEIDENDVNEALDAGADEGTPRQALSLKMGRDVEMESTKGEPLDEGGGRDACEAFRAQSSVGMMGMFCWGECNNGTARLAEGTQNERYRGWDLLSSSCGCAARILTRHNNYECNQRCARELPESRVLLSPRLAASSSSEEERTRAT